MGLVTYNSSRIGGADFPIHIFAISSGPESKSQDAHLTVHPSTINNSEINLASDVFPIPGSPLRIIFFPLASKSNI